MSKKVNRQPVKKPAQKFAITPLTIGLVVLAAIVIVGGLIFFSNMGKQGAELDRYPTKGSAAAPVTMIEYSDYGCSHCRAFLLETFPRLEKEYIDTGKLKYISHPFYLGNPLLGVATESAWCAQDQGKFFEYQRLLQEKQGLIDYTPASYVTLAGELGLDTAAFERCVNGRTHQIDVERARNAADNKGVNSTPTFYINNRRVIGNIPYDEFKTVIEEELAKSK